MPSKKVLKVFYAVTASDCSTSLYEAKIDGDSEKPVITKIRLSGSSRVKKGGNIKNGTMLGITQQLQLFVPKGGEFNSPEPFVQREILEVIGLHLGSHTSNIVGLFLRKKTAELCYSKRDGLMLMNGIPDSRWLKQTIATLRAIGKNHPYCSISTSDSRYWLLPPEKWQ